MSACVTSSSKLPRFGQASLLRLTVVPGRQPPTGHADLVGVLFLDLVSRLGNPERIYFCVCIYRTIVQLAEYFSLEAKRFYR